MHNSVVFEFPEDGAFLKEGRYYTLEAVSLSYRGGGKKEKNKNEEKKEEKKEGRELEGEINSREERGWFYAALDPWLFFT